jgi:7-cyano-7-deazaguanine synthase
MSARPRAVVLVSGGMDSVATLAIARDQGFDCYALSVDYGQRHLAELNAARRNAETLGALAHKVVHIDLRALGGSALTDDIAVPEAPSEGIPVTYVPARNTIMLAVALGWAEVLGARDLFCGVNAVDYSGYPDCRPEFIHAFETLANLATKAGVEGQRFSVHAPLVEGRHRARRRAPRCRFQRDCLVLPGRRRRPRLRALRRLSPAPAGLPRRRRRRSDALPLT